MSLSVTNAIRSSRSFSIVQPRGKDQIVLHAATVTFIRFSLCSGCPQAVVTAHLNPEGVLQVALPVHLQAVHLVSKR